MLWKYRNKINFSQIFSLPVHMTKLFTSGLFKSSQKSAISVVYWAEEIPCDSRKVTDSTLSSRWSLWQNICNTCSILPLFQRGWFVTVGFTAIFCWHWLELAVSWHNLSHNDDEHSVKRKQTKMCCSRENNTSYLEAKNVTKTTLSKTLI